MKLFNPLDAQERASAHVFQEDIATWLDNLREDLRKHTAEHGAIPYKLRLRPQRGFKEWRFAGTDNLTNSPALDSLEDIRDRALQSSPIYYFDDPAEKVAWLYDIGLVTDDDFRNQIGAIDDYTGYRLEQEMWEASDVVEKLKRINASYIYVEFRASCYLVIQDHTTAAMMKLQFA